MEMRYGREQWCSIHHGRALTVSDEPQKICEGIFEADKGLPGLTSPFLSILFFR